MSQRARAYRKAVIEAIRKDHGNPAIEGKVKVEITLHAPDERRYDVDNRIKGLLDSLQHAGLIEDDYHVDRIEIERGSVVPRGEACALVTLEKIPCLQANRRGCFLFWRH